MKLYPKMKDSGIDWIGEIPEHWGKIPLRHSLIKGKIGIKIGPFGSSLKLGIMVKSGYKVYGQENVIHSNFNIGHRFIDEKKFSELKGHELSEGDVIVTMMGTTGLSAVMPSNINKGIMDSHLVRIRVDEKICYNYFLSLLINSADYVKTQMNMASKGSIMAGLNSSILKSIQLILPQIEEQKQIFHYIQQKIFEIENKILKHTKLIKILKEKKQSIIFQSVTKGLDTSVPMKDSGITWIGEIPEHWDIKKLSHLTDRITLGIVIEPSKYFTDSGIPFLRGTNIEECHINDKSLKFMSDESNLQNSKSTLHHGDLVSIRVGYPGITAVVPKSLENSNCASLMIIGKSKKFNSDFLCYSINSNVGRIQFDLISDGAAQKQYSIIDAHNIKFPTPSISEQKLIFDYLEKQTSKINSLIAKAESQIECLQELRQSLISSVVTGKIDVRDSVA